MNVIYKYPLTVGDVQTIQLPIGSAVLSAQSQNNTPTLWVMQSDEDNQQMTDVLVMIVGTGHKFELDNWRFINTVQCGELVWHVFLRE